MKNLLIAFLLVVILLLGSFLYRGHHTNRNIDMYAEFPVSSGGKLIREDAPLYLFVFFSEHNCPPCMEVFSVLNTLPPPFCVTGVVPDNEAPHEVRIRQRTGAAFPIIGAKGLENFVPPYTPSILGVSSRGRIHFVLPAVPGETEYFMAFLESFYGKAFPLLLDVEGRDETGLH